MIIEHHTFRLAAGVSDESFLAADRRVQTEHAPFCHGFIRRTTARGEDGEWLVEAMWWSTADADAANQSGEPAQVAFLASIDDASAVVRRYETLD